MTLLQQIAYDRDRCREALRSQTLAGLKRALPDLMPAQRAIVFGSLVKPGRFSDESDVDLAIDVEPAGMSICQLTSLLSERLGRRVDIVFLPECRFRDRVLREGEVWTMPA